MTDEEKSLWYDLREFRDQGFHFRRQVPIGRYIVDFACLKAKLIIELDGIQHAEPEHERADHIRDIWLRSEGYQILRFWNDEIKEGRTLILNMILKALPLEGGGGRRSAVVGGGDRP